MESNILLSICIPTFNRAISLNYTLKKLFHILNDFSVENNDFNKIEILLSDNGSTDNTNIVASSYNLTYFKQEINRGYDENISFLYSTAKGKYILFLGDDDELINDNFKKLLHFIFAISNDIDVIFCNYNDGTDENPHNGIIDLVLKQKNKIFKFQEVAQYTPFFFLSSFILKKKSVYNEIFLAGTYGRQMEIALLILNNNSLCSVYTDYIIRKNHPTTELEGGCNVSRNAWKIHFGFAQVIRKYQIKYDIKISELAELKCTLQVYDYLLSSNENLSVKLKTFIEAISEGLKATKKIVLLFFPFYLLKIIIKKLYTRYR